MEEYILHDLHGVEPPEDELAQAAESHMHKPQAGEAAEPATPMHSRALEFVPIEEPGPNWEIELAKAYVREHPLSLV